jgi:hypothetical protein
MNRGLLLTMTEPPPAMKAEFNAWYDTEHMQERLSIPGFRSARRWVADVPAGDGRYLATYELDSASVLRSAPYLARFENPTPWSRRCLAETVVFRRWACEQVEPGSSDPVSAARALLLVAAGEAPELGVPGALQVRRFLAGEGAPPHILLAELASTAMPALPALPPKTLVRLYRAYAA